MGNGIKCQKTLKNSGHGEKSPNNKTFNRVKTVLAEEIMKKSVWFIEKEEVDNYFSKDELLYYKRTQQAKTLTGLLIPTVPAKIKYFCSFY